MSAAAVPPRRMNVGRFLRRNAWTFGTYVLFLAVLGFTIAIHPTYGPFEVETLVVGALPLAFAAVAQACVVVGGGIDLSIGAMMAVANVLAARYMQNHDFQTAIVIALLVLVGGTLAAGGANTINCVCDRDIDEKMQRTHGRPLPLGLVTPEAALRFGIGRASCRERV